MKRFRVTWHSDARSELAQIWLAAADRAAVSDAANRIDVVLSNDPEDAGDDFYGDRILVERPLAVTLPCLLTIAGCKSCKCRIART